MTNTSFFFTTSPQPPNGFKTWVQAGASIPVPSPPKPEINHLKLTRDQKSKLCDAYRDKSDVTQLTFNTEDAAQQKLATEKIAELSLASHQVESLESRWSVQWSNSWTNKGRKKKRTIYQCRSGYDTDARQKQDSKTQRAQERSSTKETWERRVPYDYTGCLAHIQVVENVDTGHVESIWGIPMHNEQCQQAVLKRLPCVPVHEHVWEVALDQMANDASLTAIQDTNLQMIRGKLYRDIETYNPKTSNVRYLLCPSDSATLYSKYGRRLGIDVKVPPQYNVSDWLDPNSSRYKPDVAKLIFHYQARATEGDRFEICISTPEMDDTAWKYAHASQLVLDGTFGVCTVRLLLFIALAVDSNNHGLPIALFLFSAPTGNRASHAGYNTKILEKLLRRWKDHLSSQREEPFSPLSVITDTDAKERGALLLVWPSIYLLLCKFHVRQCWLNNRKKALGAGDPAKPSFWKEHVREQMRGLETSLLESVTHEDAQALISQKREYLDRILSDKNADASRAAKAGKDHILYLETNWMQFSMWRSWSKHGRLTVSQLLKIPIEGVIPTTNHLESFNGVLKRKYLFRWCHSGHRLRFDYLILLLCTRILPGVYGRRIAQSEYAGWLTERFKDYAGGKDLVETHREADAERRTARKHGAGICWWPVDELRDMQANSLVSMKRIGWTVGADRDSFNGQCYSSKSNEVSYSLTLHRNGRASCTCLDFQERGGACKHLRAMRVLLDHTISSIHAPPLLYPKTLTEALAIEEASLSTLASSSLNATSISPSIPQLSSVSPFEEIQAFVQDSTTLNAGEGEEEGAGSDEEDELTGELEPVVFEETFEPPPNLNEEQRRTINAQIEAKIQHEASRLLPGLHGLHNLLGDLSPHNSSLTTSSQFSELKEVIGSMHTRMSELGSGRDVDANHNTRLTVLLGSAGEAERGRNTNLKRGRELRAPSSERRQIRKISHSTM